MPSPSIVPTFALFGATGGCCFSLLVHALRASHTVSALARTPSKLTTQLLAQGIPQSTLDTNLLITHGSATSVQDVKKCLVAGQRGDGTTAPIVVTGLGGNLTFQWSVRQPFTLDNRTICQDAATALVKALADLKEEHRTRGGNGSFQKPLVGFISTTGVSKPKGPEDVPMLFWPLYHWCLAVPHKDKRVMEEILHRGAAPGGDGVFSGTVGVRPSLLIGVADADDRKGLENVRTGTEGNPAVGYTIKRADVGEWMFREIVEKKGKGWEGQVVTLTF